MKLVRSSKMFIPLIVATALLVGFGATFAVASVMDRNKASEASHHDDEETHVTNADHGGGQNASIVADGSLSNVKADKNIDLFADKASPEEVYLTVGQVLQFNTKDDNKHRIALGQGGTEHEHISATNSGDLVRMKHGESGLIPSEHFSFTITIILISMCWLLSINRALNKRYSSITYYITHSHDRLK